MSLTEPTQADIIAARERGYATQAALNGMEPEAIVNHIPVYNTQADQRESRLNAMHEAITSGRNQG